MTINDKVKRLLYFLIVLFVISLIISFVDNNLHFTSFYDLGMLTTANMQAMLAASGKLALIYFIILKLRNKKFHLVN